jgi:glycosyltransferase involved in cell wall biosynthesis
VPICATNNVGPYGVGDLIFRPGETKEVTNETAAYLLTLGKEFSLRHEGDGSDYPFRDEDGKVKYLSYFGPVDSRFGYGGGGITILRALSALGIQARVNSHYNNDPDFQLAYTRDLPPDALCQLEHRRWLPKWELAHCLPNDYSRSGGARYRVAWTMWEMDKVPDGTNPKADVYGDWVGLINRDAQRLVVPCQHNAEVFEACGVRLPISVIPYGLDTEIWPFFERPTDRDIFTVVLYGDLTDRKGPFEAVQAFQRAFGQQDDVRLILKTQGYHLGKGATPQQMPIIRDPRIRVINESWTRAQLVEMLHSADCFLWPSRGEGFGLPPLQAALTGLPVLMTTHTGMGAYYDKRYFYKIQDAGKSPGPLYGNWYDPDVDSAADQLRHIYENRGAALRKGRAASTYVRREFSLSAFAARLGAYLDTLD